jgi:hypothetical protein
MTNKKGSLVHVAPTCALGLMCIVFHCISARDFPRLEPMTSWSQVAGQMHLFPQYQKPLSFLYYLKFNKTSASCPSNSATDSQYKTWLNLQGRTRTRSKCSTKTASLFCPSQFAFASILISSML